MHRAEGTEHFHSLKTTQWPVARKNTPIFRQERIHLAICPSIFESPRLRIFLSTHTPALQKQSLACLEINQELHLRLIGDFVELYLFEMIETKLEYYVFTLHITLYLKIK